MLKYQLVYNKNKGMMKVFSKDIKEEFATATLCYNRMNFLLEFKSVDKITIFKDNKKISLSEMVEDYVGESIKQKQENENKPIVKKIEQKKIDEHKIQILYDNNLVLEIGVEKETMKMNIKNRDMLLTFKNSRRDNDFFVEYEILARSVTMMSNLRDMDHIKSFLNEVFSDSVKKGHVMINYF